MSDTLDFIKNDGAVINQLKSKLVNEFSTYLMDKSVVILDYPVYLNIGDLLIHEGIERLLRQLNTKIVARFSARNQNVFFDTKLDNDVILLFNGGGNFGDLYTQHQAFRERAIKAFPNNKIIVMPQSVHYEDLDNLATTSAIYESHNDLHIFVRDEPSYHVLTQYLRSTDIKMMPDTAFLIDDIYTVKEHMSNKILKLRRRDVEMQNDCKSPSKSFDWDDLLTNFDRRVYDVIRYLCRIENKFKIRLFSDRAWLCLSQRLVRKAINFFNDYGVVDTDRLHGMILALLVGCDVIKRDNSYGKLSRYASFWLATDNSNNRETVSQP